MDFWLYCFFFISVLAPIYTYFLYPFIIMVFPKKNYKVNMNYRPNVSIIIAAYNEEHFIGDRIKNLLSLDYPKDKIEFLIGSDGSNDNTIRILSEFAWVRNLVVFDLPRGGKVSVINHLINKANGDILIFSDANTMFKEDAILKLVKCFADDRIGCVSGQLRYKIDEESGHGAKSESTYWKYENWIKEKETVIGKLSGANGAIYGVRSELVKQIPKGIINDDFYISTFVMQNGYDVIMNNEAIAYEVPNDDFTSQFKRHIRDGAGHYQAMVVFANMLFSKKGGFVYFSHRVVRWLVPFCLISAFVANFLLKNDGYLYNLLFSIQFFGYIVMMLYYVALKTVGFSNKILNIPFYFLSVNVALLFGFIKFIMKRQDATWETERDSK